MNRRLLIILLILFILSLVGITLYGGPVTYLFFFLVLLLPLSNALYILYVISSIRLYQETDGRDMTCSVPSDFYLTLSNESPLSFSSVRMIFYSSFSTITGLDDRTEYELPPHSTIKRRTKLVCRYRGEYLVGIKELEVKGLFGLFTVKYMIKEPLSVIVAPAMVQLNELRFGEDNEDSDRDSLQNRTEPDITVREYVPGDNPRLLHHKASAVMQKPMIRELKGGEKDGIMIIMESERHYPEPERYLPSENRIIECTLALTLYYVSNNIPVDVVYRTTAMNSVHVRTYQEYEGLYEIMRSFSFGEKGSTISLLNELCYGTHVGNVRMIVPVLIDFGEEERLLTEKLNISRVPLRVYLTGREPAPEPAVYPGDAEIIPVGTLLPTEEVL